MSKMIRGRKPNILWIFSDQHREQAMSCSGCPNVETPNLDSLAAEGVRFSEAYSISPLCSPFRASVYTSQYIHEHGVNSLHKPIKPGIQMLPEILQDNGYHTIHLGKWHLSGGAAPSHFVAPYFRPGWNTWIGWENSNRPFETQYAEGDYPIPLKTLPGYQTDSLTDLAIEQLNSLNDKHPWFMVVSIEPPHDPHVAPDGYMKEYEERDIQFRANVPEEWKTPENTKRAKGYYAQIKNLDDNIGRLIDTLKANNQYDNTVIMYFSDHGEFMGSHNRTAKFFAEVESSKIPFIVRHPDSFPDAFVCDALVSSIDIPTTTLGLAGIPIPAGMHGLDHTGAIMNQAPHYQEDIIVELDSWFDDDNPEYGYRALLTKEYMFIKARNESKCGLYDLINDPYQMVNLYGSFEHESVRIRLEKRLEEKLHIIGDDFYPKYFSSVQCG